MSTINENTTRLLDILNTVNSLPTSGESAQLCNITINATAPCTIFYEDIDGCKYSRIETAMSSVMLSNVIVNSMFVVCHPEHASNGYVAEPSWGEGIEQKTSVRINNTDIYGYVFICSKSCDTNITFTN